MDKSVLFLSRMVESFNVGDIKLLKDFLKEDVVAIILVGGNGISKSPLYNSSSKEEVAAIVERADEYIQKLIVQYGLSKDKQTIKCVTEIKSLISKIKDEMENDFNIPLILVYIYKIICNHLLMRNMIDLRLKNVDTFNSKLIEKFFSEKEKLNFNIDALDIDNILIKMKEFFSLINSDFILKNERELMSNYMSNLNATIIKNVRF